MITKHIPVSIAIHIEKDRLWEEHTVYESSPVEDIVLAYSVCEIAGSVESVVIAEFCRLEPVQIPAVSVIWKMPRDRNIPKKSVISLAKELAVITF